MKKIVLHGWLGRRFGRSYAFDVQSAAEAVRALSSQIPGFRAALETARIRANSDFAVFYGMSNIPEAELTMTTSARTIRFLPVIVGAKGGLLQTVVGITLIAIALFVPMPPVLSAALFNLGVSLTIGGIVQMLTPDPNASRGDKADNTPGSHFNGPINTQAQGYPVPLLYGVGYVGSAVISAGIVVSDYSTTYNDTGGSGGGGGQAAGPQYPPAEVP